MDNKITDFEGKTIESYEPNDVCDRVVLNFTDKTSVVLTLDGDCCSRSYFTDPKQFQELVGTVIVEAVVAAECTNRATENYPEDKWYFLKFTTNKGHVTIDWRNESNGYYDGRLSWVFYSK